VSALLIGARLGIDWGLELERYWETTPKEYYQYLEVYKTIEENRAKEMDFNNFNLGKYVAYAVNDPKKYPKKPFLQEVKEESKVMTDEEMDRVMKRNTIALGGIIK